MKKDRDVGVPSMVVGTLPEYVRDGATITIECIETAVRKGAVWKGNWRVYAYLDEVKYVLVAVRTLQPRDHKTPNAVFSFAESVGLRVPGIPMDAGVFATFTEKDFDFTRARIASEVNG